MISRAHFKQLQNYLTLNLETNSRQRIYCANGERLAKCASNAVIITSSRSAEAEAWRPQQRRRRQKWPPTSVTETSPDHIARW